MSTENLPDYLSSFQHLILVFLGSGVEMWMIDNLNRNVSVKTECWSCSVIGCRRVNLATNCTEK